MTRALYLVAPCDVQPTEHWRYQGSSRWFDPKDPDTITRLNREIRSEREHSGSMSPFYYHVEVARETTP